jgi:hypothetical protein
MFPGEACVSADLQFPLVLTSFELFSPASRAIGRVTGNPEVNVNCC